jgi:hypothetical protein
MKYCLLEMYIMIERRDHCNRTKLLVRYLSRSHLDSFGIFQSLHAWYLLEDFMITKDICDLRIQHSLPMLWPVPVPSQEGVLFIGHFGGEKQLKLNSVCHPFAICTDKHKNKIIIQTNTNK